MWSFIQAFDYRINSEIELTLNSCVCYQKWRNVRNNTLVFYGFHAIAGLWVCACYFSAGIREDTATNVYRSPRAVETRLERWPLAEETKIVQDDPACRESLSETITIPVEADFLIGWATVPGNLCEMKRNWCAFYYPAVHWRVTLNATGYFSWRNVHQGSVFIRHLCACLNRYGPVMEIMQVCGNNVKCF